MKADIDYNMNIILIPETDAEISLLAIIFNKPKNPPTFHPRFFPSVGVGESAAILDRKPSPEKTK